MKFTAHPGREMAPRQNWGQQENESVSQLLESLTRWCTPTFAPQEWGAGGQLKASLGYVEFEATLGHQNLSQEAERKTKG